jgi:RHS repeat-associated protein
MKTKIILLFFIITNFLCVGQISIEEGTLQSIDNFNIVGEALVSNNKTESYTAETSKSNIKIYWSVSGGEIISGKENTIVLIKWGTGTKGIVYCTFFNDIGEILKIASYNVRILTPEDKPLKPTIESVNCASAILRKGTSPSNVTWYWQGTESNGRSKLNADVTYNVTASGTYYIRAYRNEGVWSDSSSIDVLLTGCDTYTSDDENYIHTINYLQPYKEAALSNNTTTEKTEAISYFDALGRVKQSIAVNAGGNKEDIVTHVEYDASGRQVKEYLPYAVSTNNGNIVTGNVALATETYYKNKYPSDFSAQDLPINVYSQKQFDGSPLNRILKQAAPGQDWRIGSGHEVSFENQTNIFKEVKIFEVTTTFADNTYTPSLVGGSNFHDTGELYKTVTKDENWTAGLNHTTEEFKDKQGQVILKRTYANVEGIATAHDTYYVYDDFGNLTYVLPPKIDASRAESTLAIIQLKLNDLGYQYKYDHRNRLVEKRIPGKEWEYIVYDKLDRPVLTQDANLKEQNKWLFTKYDILGRAAYTGYAVNNSSRIALQNIADGSGYTQYEVKTSASQVYGDASIYYSKIAIPTAITKVYTVSYYDTYVDLPSDLNNTLTTSYGVIATTNTKGLATVNKTRILGTNSWITTVSYYDDKARPVYIYSKNDFLNTTDIVESKLDDFTGKVLETRTTHKKIGKATIVTIDSFVYDHMNRLLSQSQCIGDETLTSCNNASNTTNVEFNTVMSLSSSKTIVDNNSITLKDGFHVIATTNRTATFSIADGSAEHLVSNIYDDLGQLKSKKVGNTTAKPLQFVDYKYNVRGWLKNINQDGLNDKDLFNFTIKYNDPTNPSKALYNGNISQTSWNTLSTDKSAKVYTYSYDALNRITTATGVLGNKYDVSGIIYDKNGNILRLKRNGHLNANATSFGLMDNLEYAYINNGNQLQKVFDSANKDYGFRDVSNITDYIYDANGNMIIDKNKGISNITYNHLNLPTQVTIGSKNIDYTYDAAGMKLSKTVNGVTTQYAGNYIYENDVLQFFNHPEGYVTPKNASDITQGFKYVYQYKDHLGNVRLSYTDNNNDGVIQTDGTNSEIVEESNYYPFGLKHKGYNNNISSIGNSTAQKFGYNGIELNESLGLNLMEMDFRLYDPAIGRFNGIDPVTHHSQGTSVAFDNNPIYWADPSGADAQSVIDEMLAKSTGDKTTWTNNGDGTFSGSNNATATDEDHVVNDDEKETQTIADDLNRIFKNKYGKTPFSVEKTTRLEYKWTFSHYFLGGKAEYVKKETYKIVGSIGFDWDQHYYVRMLKDIIDADSDIMVDIIPDKSRYDGATGNGLMSDFYGGHTQTNKYVILSDLLKIYAGNSSHSTGGVALHELLRHIHPDGDIDVRVSDMREYFTLKGGKPHYGVRVKSNMSIRRVTKDNYKQKK